MDAEPRARSRPPRNLAALFRFGKILGSWCLAKLPFMNAEEIRLKLKQIITIDGQGRPKKAKYLLDLLEEAENIDLLKEELKRIMTFSY